MVKVFAFDFGGVLGSDADEWNTTFKKVIDEAGVTRSQILNIWDKYWSGLKIGKGEIMDYWKELSMINNKDPEKLRQIYNRCIRIDNEVLDIAKNLKKKYKIIILSNDTFDWMNAKRERFHLENIFEKIYNSAELGFSKPGKKIFEYVLKDQGIKPEELVFIDNQENNYQGATKVGINTILYKNPTQLRSEIKRYL